MPRSAASVWLAAPLLVAPVVIEAVQYLSVEQTQRVLFPAATEYAPLPLALTQDQVKAIERVAKADVPRRPPQVWTARAGMHTLGHVYVDEVYGKHEFITYALGIGPDGRVVGVEIVAYRETHGEEVRLQRWRAQFVGKRAGDPVKLGGDIQNISGATLSCRHLTDGVRRLLITHRLVVAAGP